MPRYIPRHERAVQCTGSSDDVLTKPTMATPIVNPAWSPGLDWEDSLNSFEYNQSPRVIQELLGPLAQWPIRPRILFEQGHLSHKERFILITFLLGNGVPPCWIWAHLHFRACLRDKSAISDIQDLIRSYRSGGFPRKNDTYSYYDIARGKMCHLHDK